eukprot:15483490-Alexandrium_andersonii.AAC.1
MSVAAVAESKSAPLLGASLPRKAFWHGRCHNISHSGQATRSAEPSRTMPQQVAGSRESFADIAN